MEDLHEQVKSGKYDLIIADEINYCIYRGLLSVEKAIQIDPNYSDAYWNLHSLASDIDEA